MGDDLEVEVVLGVCDADSDRGGYDTEEDGLGDRRISEARRQHVQVAYSICWIEASRGMAENSGLRHTSTWIR